MPYPEPFLHTVELGRCLAAGAAKNQRRRGGGWENRAKDNEENTVADERMTVRKKVLFLEAKRGK
jgi:hypothetical protein